jgi:HicA toxin of bacterial toxin-antitoxin,
VAIWYLYRVSRAEKAIQRLLRQPRDFTWDEFTTVMESFDYELKTGAGSSRKFIHRATRVVFMIHEPHPAKVLKAYQVKSAITFLKQEKHI